MITRTLQDTTDKAAISLSLLCAIHCLILPLAIIMLPSFSALQLLDRESFHIWMLLAVIPSSLYSLTIGCKNHRDYSVAFTAIPGLLLMISAVLFGESHLGENGEKLLTLIGACMIAVSHFRNYRLCRQHQDCRCQSAEKTH